MLTEVQRKNLLKLAHENPKMRKAILAKLRAEAAAPSYRNYLKKKQQQGKKPLSQDEWERKVLQTGQSGEELKKEKAKKPDVKGDEGSKSYKKSYPKPVTEVMDKYNMTDGDAAQVAAWKKRKPWQGTPISDAEKLRRFLRNAKPETKERMKGMTPAEFAQILGAIMEDEEGGKTAMEFPTEDARKKYLKEHPGADPSKHTVTKGKPGGKGPKEKAPGKKEPGKKETEKSEGKAKKFDSSAATSGARKKMEKLIRSTAFDGVKYNDTAAAAWATIGKAEEALVKGVINTSATQEDVDEIWDEMMGQLEEAYQDAFDEAQKRGEEALEDEYGAALDIFLHNEYSDPPDIEDYREDLKADKSAADAALRQELIRLATEHPETRKHILPLLRAAAKSWGLDVKDVKKGDKVEIGLGSPIGSKGTYKGTVFRISGNKVVVDAPGAGLGDRHAVPPKRMRKLGTLDKTAAGKPSLEKEGLNKETVNAKMGFMVYHIDPEANKSKFYEVLIKPDGAGFRLMRRWGALTDSGATGRVDKRDEFHPTVQAAQRSMMGHYSKRIKRGYTDAFRAVSSWASGPNHVSPVDGKRLPYGQYPVGLTRDVGFGWGTQSVTQCIPALRALVEHVDQAREVIKGDTEAYYPPGEVIDHLSEALDAVDAVAHADSSMGNKLKNMITKAQRRAIGGGKFRPDPGNQQLSRELYSIRNYVTKQTSYCA